MGATVTKKTTIHISSKAHLNLTFNLCQCGRREIDKKNPLSICSGDLFTMVYVNQGEGIVESNDLRCEISKAQGFFAFPDMKFDFSNPCDEVLDITWLSFTGYLVENYLNRANIYRAKPIYEDHEEEVGEKINGIYTASFILPNRYCRMISALYDIFSCLLDRNPTKKVEGYVDNANFFASKAVDYVEQHYALNISVDEIAAALGISRKHLYSVFNDILKISPKQYLIYYRIEKACVRLKSTSLSVQEIAESVGYSNQFYFAKEFKRLTGMTPTTYRNNPYLSEVFSYRLFVPTLKEHMQDESLSLPHAEVISSVFSSPQPANDNWLGDPRFVNGSVYATEIPIREKDMGGSDAAGRSGVLNK